MPLFVISWRDKPGSLDARMAAREAHLAYIAAHRGQVKLGGPFLDEAGRMVGSLIIIEAEDQAAAEAWHASDPYKLADLPAETRISPWRQTIGTLD